MISVREALAMVLDRAVPRPAATLKAIEAVGLVLAEDVTSDVNSPPHDKAMVDGYAVVADDLTGGSAQFVVLEQVVAGTVPHRAVTPGSATRIMTGAPIPEGANAVVMVEKTRLIHDKLVEINQEDVAPGQHILPMGASIRRGDVVLSRGVEIRPIEVGLLSEVGRAKVQAIGRPHVAVLATGDELVPISREIPAAGKIRNSNGPMLAAAAHGAGAAVIDLGVAPDEEPVLARLITKGLESDVLLLSGGVSAGVLDLVPGTLQSLGAEQVFHHVRLKPGKPLWFGVKRGEPCDTLIFGLPGNPVGALVCFELFVRPALARLAGKSATGPRSLTARLARPHQHRGDRPTYHPARLKHEEGRSIVEAVAWQGSADLAGLTRANALMLLEEGVSTYAAGDEVQVFPL